MLEERDPSLMESFLHGFLCLLLLASVAGAQEKKAAGLPPLIDRELIFGNPEIAAAELSPMASTLPS